MAWKRVDGLRTIEFGAPGEHRDTILSFLLDGNKRATCGHLEHDYISNGEALEHVGEVLVVLDSNFEEVGRIRATRIEQTTFGAVPDEFALAEAEGDLNAADFRASHIDYWTDMGYEMTDDTQVVLLYFDLL